MFKFNLLITTTAIPLILLLAIPHNAFAWDFGNNQWFGGFQHWGLFTYGQPGAYQKGYYAGQEDAIYDHDNGHQYTL